jgi:hypothetical protein
MTRPTTVIKEKIVIRHFHNLLRSGKDYTTCYMYQTAGEKCYMSGITAGAIIRSHYKKKIITQEMRNMAEQNKTSDFDTLLRLFCCQFSVCSREGRLILGYIR